MVTQGMNLPRSLPTSIPIHLCTLTACLQLSAFSCIDRVACIVGRICSLCLARNTLAGHQDQTDQTNQTRQTRNTRPDRQERPDQLIIQTRKTRQDRAPEKPLLVWNDMPCSAGPNNSIVGTIPERHHNIRRKQPYLAHPRGAWGQAASQGQSCSCSSWGQNGDLRRRLRQGVSW